MMKNNSLKKVFVMASFCAAVLFAVFTVSGCDSANRQSEGQKPLVYAVNGIKEGGDLSFVKEASFNGETVSFTSEKCKEKYNRVITSKNGIFKPNTDYILEFSAKVENSGSLLALIRSDKYPKSGDYSSTSIANTSGGVSTRTMHFKTDQNAADYRLCMSTVDKAKVEICDVKIYEGSLEKYYAPVANPKPYKLDRKGLPTGSKEFDVLLPNNTGGAVVKASDFGVKVGEKDIITKLNLAIEHCRKIKAAKLVVDKGQYYLNEEKSIEIKDMQDFEFDGGGSTFVFYKTNNRVPNMKVDFCKRTLLRNFNFDWDWEKSPLASIVEVVKIDRQKKFVDVKFLEYDDFPKKDCRIVNLSVFDPKTQSVGTEFSFDIYYDFGVGNKIIIPQKEWLSGNLLRMHLSEVHHGYEVGQQFRMQHYYYVMNGIVQSGNVHLTLKDINIYSCAGHAFVIKDKQQYWHFKNVNIKKPENKFRRAITCTADHCHVANTLGYAKYEDCEFSYGADDCINFHDNSGFARRKSEYSLITSNVDRSNFNNDSVIELRNGDFSPTGFTAKLKACKNIDPKKGVYEFIFDQKVPQEKIDGFVMFNRNYATRNMILRNCYFHDNRARGVIIECPDVTIENCRFKHSEHGALKIESGYTFNLWSEGYGADNIVVRNCTFEQGSPHPVAESGKARDVYMGVYMRYNSFKDQTMYPIINNVLFENNTFIDSFGSIASISSAGNVTFVNNKFIAKTPRVNEKYYRGAIYASYASNIKIVNNTWYASPLVKNPGAFIETRKVNGFVFEGNKIVKEKE